MDVNIGTFIKPQRRRWIGRVIQETPRKYSKTTYTKNDLREDPRVDGKMIWRMTYDRWGLLIEDK
jgi:hypothetical protein